MKQSENMTESEHKLDVNESKGKDKVAEELREIPSSRSHEEQVHPDVPSYLPVETLPNFEPAGIKRRPIFSIDSDEKLEDNLNPQIPQKVESKPIAINQIEPIVINLGQLSTRECSFCAEFLGEEKFEKVFKCDHTFCKSCLKVYVEMEMKNFKIVACPTGKCIGEMDEESLYFKSLGLEAKEKYQIIKFRNAVEKNPKLILCPDQKCKKGSIEVVEGSKTGQCKQCKVVYCLNCKMKSHSGKCESFEDILLKDKFKYKKCYGCSRVVERNQGCPHMTCKCGSQFCYYCAGKWEVPHRCLRYMAGGDLITDKLNEKLKCLRHEDYEYEYTFVGFLVKVPYYLVCLLLMALYIGWCLTVLAALIVGVLVCSFFSGYIALMYKLCRDGNSIGKVAFVILLILMPLGFVIGWIAVFVFCLANAMPRYFELALSARLFPCYLCS